MPADNGDSMRHRLLERYSGSASSIRVDRWLNLYEVVASKENTDRKKITLLMTYLSSDALDWYATDICPIIASSTWKEVRDRMTERFGTPVVHPLIEAQQRQLKASEDVQTYYNDMMRLLRQAGVNDDAAVAQLIQGMPISYRPALASARLKTPQEWLMLAKQLEPMLKPVGARRMNGVTHFANAHQEGYADMTRNLPVSRTDRPPRTYVNARPPAPCRYCKDRGLTSWHWHSECSHRNPQSSRQSSVRAPNSMATSASASVQPPEVTSISNPSTPHPLN